MEAARRFDKVGRRLPETGRGCGCRLCEESNAGRYERRGHATATPRSVWHPFRRSLVAWLRSLGDPVR